MNEREVSKDRFESFLDGLVHVVIGAHRSTQDDYALAGPMMEAGDE